MVIRYFRLMIIGLRKLVCVAFGRNWDSQSVTRENLVLSGNHRFTASKRESIEKLHWTNALFIFSIMWTHLMRGSSPVDWCEDNYTYSPVIAEFFNTVSNALFLVMPPFLMHLHQPYAASIGKGIHLIWFLLIGKSRPLVATFKLIGMIFLCSGGCQLSVLSCHPFTFGPTPRRNGHLVGHHGRLCHVVPPGHDTPGLAW